jgi:hypothetical protein
VWQTLLAGHQLGGLEKIASPLSVGILAPLLYWVYNNWLWRIFAGLPDLNGTWIGMGNPNYRDSHHLHLMHIVQTWSSIHIRSEAFRLPPGVSTWHDGREYVGTDESKCATVSHLLGRHSTLEFTDNHKGNGTTITVSNWQVRFFRRIWRVVSSFFVNRNDHAVAEGYYYTNRFYPGEEGRRCSWGCMYYRFVSADVLTIDEVLPLFKADQLAEVQKKLVALAAASPDYVKSKFEALESRITALESASNNTPNQALQQTGAAGRLSGIRSSPSGPGC